MRSHIPCNNPHHALTSLNDLRSTFELGPKDINALGKAIFIGRIGLDNLLCYVTIFSSRSIQLTIITKPSAEKSGQVLA